ncbi:MAG: SDR family oxidoreductase [Planctomycetaceae bacterium]|jgi:3-oxoacyl-[acyl-carrier protein] reductase|nr:SDR family oxidoreductase [Planctomycetaceae bacterium]
MPNPRNILITGATGGIGRETAQRFAASENTLLLHTHNNIAQLEQFATELKAANEIICLQSDLSKPEERKKFLTELTNTKKQIDVFIQAAGIDLMRESARSLTFDERLEVIWQLDVVATITLSRYIGEQMKQRGKGNIVLFGWNEIDYGMKGSTAQLYATAKGATLGFMRSLAHELAPEVRVNAISPGWIKTRWGKKASTIMQETGNNAALLNRWGEPKEIADAIMYLTSESSTFVTKQNIIIDGGRR